MANIDLDILLPESEIISFTGTDDGKKYEIDLFIPSIFFAIMANKDLTTEEQQSKMLESFLKRKYKHMTKDWIDINISAPRQNKIANLIIEKISKESDLVGTEE